MALITRPSRFSFRLPSPSTRRHSIMASSYKNKPVTEWASEYVAASPKPIMPSFSRKGSDTPSEASTSTLSAADDCARLEEFDFDEFGFDEFDFDDAEITTAEPANWTPGVTVVVSYIRAGKAKVVDVPKTPTRSTFPRASA